jgi:hypothetical protein
MKKYRIEVQYGSHPDIINLIVEAHNKLSAANSLHKGYRIIHIFEIGKV